MNASIVASVVFLKIQDFGRRPASEQARLRAQLEAVVAVVTAEVPPASRIVLEASDGTAIVFIADPAAALRLAQRALTAAAAGLPLSAGLNHGALQLSGKKGAEGSRGDGIAVAASVADTAASSRLLTSRSFRDALADAAPGAEAELVSVGTFTDAGLRTHEIFTSDARALARRRRRYGVVSAALAIGLLAAGIGWRISTDGNASLISPAMAHPLSHPYVRALVQRVSH